MAGHSVKTAVSHSVVRDRRNDLFLPTTGYLVKLFNELASVKGRQSGPYLKSEIETQIVSSPLKCLVSDMFVIIMSSSV